MTSSGMKCTCSPAGLFWLVLGAIVLAVGVWLFVAGIRMQWDGGAWLSTLVWYAAGIFVLGLGKMLKWKGCTGCPVHKM